MATVHLARMTGTAGFEKLVAIKTIHPHLAADPRFVEMFLDEARIASQIHHPNVCTVFDFGEAGGTYYMAMEYLVGQSLYEALEAVIALNDQATLRLFPLYAARILADAAEGLHAAHEQLGSRGQTLGIVHRDVSPQNFIVTYEGGVKVTDFGCAKAIQRVSQTSTGTLKGKVGYAAPEQLRVEPVDRRADVWGLGVCLWESITYERLFRRETDVQTALAVLSDPIPYAAEGRPWVPNELADIAARALERDPAARYPTAREMSRDLRRFLTRSGYAVESAELGDFMRQVLHGGLEHHRASMELAHSLAEGELDDEAPTEERRASQVDPRADTEPPPPMHSPSPPERAPPSTGPSGLRVHREDIVYARRRGRSAWPVALLVLLAASAAGAYYAFGEGTIGSPGASAAGDAPGGERGAEPPDRRIAGAENEPVRREAEAPDTPDAPNTPASSAAPPPSTMREPAAASPEGTASPSTARAARARDDGAPVTTVRVARQFGSSARAAEEPSRPAATDRGADDDGAAAEAVIPSTGTVRIIAEGGWSTVVHDGRELGRTPLTVELPTGTQTLQLLPFGRAPGDTHTVRVYGGSSVSLRIAIREDDGTPE